MVIEMFKLPTCKVPPTLPDHFVNKEYADSLLAFLSGYAQLDSPEFIGRVTVPTAEKGSNNSLAANTNFVNTAIETAIANIPPASIESTIIYPNGTASAPATLTTAQRIVVESPYKGFKVSCTLQLFIGGIWGDVDVGYYYAHGFGCKASQLGDSIIIQSGDSGILTRSSWDCNPFNLSDTTTSALFRVYCEKGGINNL